MSMVGFAKRQKLHPFSICQDLNDTDQRKFWRENFQKIFMTGQYI